MLQCSMMQMAFVAKIVDLEKEKWGERGEVNAVIPSLNHLLSPGDGR